MAKKQKNTAEKETSHIPTMQEVVDFCKQHGFTGSVVGKWVWLFFEEKPEDAIRKLLKD